MMRITVGLIVALTLIILAAPLAAAAKQPAHVSRIAFLGYNFPPSAAESTPFPEAFRQGLRKRGWVEGDTITIEWRWAEGSLQRFATLATYYGDDVCSREGKPWMLAWSYGHETLLWWVGALSILMFVGTLVALPLVVARLPADYFRRDRHATHHHKPSAALRLLGLLGKNLLGIVLVCTGVAMLVLPGQGILTLLIGLMLINFPGKRALEQRLVRQPTVLRAMNWMRAKAHQPALELPTSVLPSTSGREER